MINHWRFLIVEERLEYQIARVGNQFSDAMMIISLISSRNVSLGNPPTDRLHVMRYFTHGFWKDYQMKFVLSILSSWKRNNPRRPKCRQFINRAVFKHRIVQMLRVQLWRLQSTKYIKMPRKQIVNNKRRRMSPRMILNSKIKQIKWDLKTNPSEYTVVVLVVIILFILIHYN